MKKVSKVTPLDELIDVDMFPEQHAVMRCPNCGYAGGLHIRKLECNAGGHCTWVDDTGTLQRRCKPDGRGTSIRIHYVCERCCEKTSLYQRFQKGVIEVETKSHGMMKTSDVYSKWDIWRD